MARANMKKKNQQLQIGIVGLGRIADLHWPGYAGNRLARVYAVCDANGDLAAARKKEWKAERAYADFGEMLADPAVDAVEILTPQRLHEEMAVAAAGAGKHVALQKPMTTDLASADRILRAAEKSGVLFKVTENYVFYPPILLARKLIDDGAIGAPQGLRIKLTSGGSGGWDVPASSWEWRMREKAEGRGMQTFDHGHHLYSTARFLMGEVERLAAWIDSVDGVVDSPATIMLKFAGKTAHGVIDYTISPDLALPSRYYANDEWIEVTGSAGIIVINRCTGLLRPGPVLGLFTGKKWKWFNEKSDWREGFIGATHNFIRAIRGEEEPNLSGPAGREVLRVALAVAQSARERREVYPGDMGRAFPRLRALARRRRETRGARSPRGDHAREGDPLMAARLIEGLPGRYDPAAVPRWRCLAGIEVLPEGGAPASSYVLRVGKDGARIAGGAAPQSAAVVLAAPAGTWAAILSGGESIESAFLRGALAVRGKAEEGLKLKAAFRL